jgi:uncharacterized protein YejL (UPF0352 family)
MTKEEIVRQLCYDLFDVVEKYNEKLTMSEVIGVLEMHKQEILWHHFQQVKQEMLAIREQHD